MWFETRHALVLAILGVAAMCYDEPVIYSGTIRDVASVAFSPDGSWLATGGTDGEVVLWAANSCLGEHRLGRHDGSVAALAFSRDGRLLASGDLYKMVKLWEIGGAGDAIEPKEVQTWKIDGAIDSLAFAADGKRLLIGSHDNALLIYSTESPHRSDEPQRVAHDFEVLSIAIAHDGKSFATGDGGGNVRLFESNDAKPIVHTKLDARITSLAFSVTDDRLYCAAAEAGIQALEPKTLKLDAKFPKLVIEANALAIAPDGSSLVAGTQDSLVKIVSTLDGKVLRTLEGHEGPVISVSIAAAGSPLASASRDRTLRVWTLER